MKTPRKWTTTKIGATTASLLFVIFPAQVLAQVKITEMMYDAPGADEGHEWVEVANLGPAPVDMGKYKLFENDTNHALQVIEGSSTLAPGAAAVIVDDAKKFAADYPAFSGTLFDSTFSLSNTGETLALKDASSSVLDSVAYGAVPQANGTGGTLNLQNNSFVAAMASPGIYPGPMTPVPPPAPKAPAKVAAKPSSTSATASSKISSAKGSAGASAPLPQSGNAASLSFVPPLSQPVLAGLGLLAIGLCGAAGLFFMRKGKPETSLSSPEFTIE